jgi:biopolymer transport protein ExbB
MKVSNSFVYGTIAALALAFAAAPASAQDPAATAAPAATDPAATDPAAVDPAAVDPAAAPATEEVAPIAETKDEEAHNPFGLMALIKEGGPVSLVTLILMALMSIASWYIFITKIFAQNALYGQAAKAGRKFWAAGNIEDAIASLDSGSVFRKIATDGLAAAEHHAKHLSGKVSLYEWVGAALRRSVSEVSGRLQGGNAVLASVGSVSPFVGLFGTVWGILQALIKIGVTGQASIDKVAGPVGEALIMTAIGLAVAIPAVAFYNVVLRRNKQITDALSHFADDVEAFLVSGSRVGADGKRRK